MDCSEIARRIELALDTPTEAGKRAIRLWSNLPEEIGAGQVAELHRTRWRIEGMFQRLGSVLNSELRSLGHPRAALLGFAVAVLAHNVLSLLQRCVEQAHQDQKPPEVLTYHLPCISRAARLLDLFYGPQHLRSREWGVAGPGTHPNTDRSQLLVNDLLCGGVS